MTVARLLIDVWALLIIILSSLFHMPFLFCKHTNTLTALLGTAGRGQGDKLWSGLIRHPEHGWQWSNGRPYRYLNWDSGKFYFHFYYKITVSICTVYIPYFLYHLYFRHSCVFCNLLLQTTARATLQTVTGTEDVWLFSSLDSRLTIIVPEFRD